MFVHADIHQVILTMFLPTAAQFLGRELDERAMTPVELGGACASPYFGNTPEPFLEVVVIIAAAVDRNEREFDAVDVLAFGGRNVDELEVFSFVRA